jgi:aminopeptidase N
MRSILCLILFVTLSLAAIGLATAESDLHFATCGKSSTFLAPAGKGTGQRQYAPDREVEVLHLALDITPDFGKRTITGRALIHLRTTAKPVREIHLDAVELRIASVKGTVPIQGWHVTEEGLDVTLTEPLAPAKEMTLTIEYSAEPENGLYFRTPEMGYREGDTHLFTQGESITARCWYPCLDSPNQRFTSEITCRVPEGMTVISNGRLVSQAQDPATGLVAFHWKQEKTHVSYLISLVAGHFKKLEDRCGSTPLGFYTPPSEFEAAAGSFRGTKEMMAFFEKEIGVPYPWEKYDQVCVNDFVAGGMENTSATTLTDGTLFTDATENLRSSEGLVAHELAHQWFGDLVTCKDWSHLWLNEGFATYYESLYAGHAHGRDMLLYELYERTKHLTSMPNDTNAIVRRTFGQPDEMFGSLTYPKASWVLHMLRSELGEELYRSCVQTYLKRHAYGIVTTEDFRRVIEELSGRSFDQFFDQWLYHAHHPELEVNYSWDEVSKLARVSVRQTQELGPTVLLFNIPLTLRFTGAFGSIDQTVRVKAKQEDFYFPLGSAPQAVRVDPEYTLLTKTRFELPRPMLYSQLTNRQDVIGRLLAVEVLAGKRDSEAMAKLQEALNQDPFFGVRLEAARGLRAIHTDAALDALLKSAAQSDARVRQEVVDSVGSFYGPKARAFALKVLETEKNPGIIAEALRSLAGYQDPEVADQLKKTLASKSFRNELTGAAIAAMEAQDDPTWMEPIRDTLTSRGQEFTSYGFAQGLETLGYLGRNESSKEALREFLLGYTNDKRRAVQLGSLRALGTLRDPKAIPAVQKFATGPKAGRVRSTAERALTELRSARRPVDDFKNLRQEVMDLQQANRDLRRELDDLKKKIEAAAKASPTEATGSSSKKPKPAKSSSR